MIDQLGDAILTVVSVVHRQLAQSNLSQELSNRTSRVSWLPPAAVHEGARYNSVAIPYWSVEKRELRSPLYIGRNYRGPS